MNQKIQIILAFFLLFFSTVTLAQQETSSNTAFLLNIDGAIGPATQDYIHRGIQLAKQQHAKLIILQMDTPGGLDKSMREIIKDIIASPIPIVSYVAPSGARAASAGTYILYASHIAAMAPGTNLGAATPVSIGGGFPGTTPENGKSKESKKQEPSAMEAKIKQDATAYIRSLAQLRKRNVEWATMAVLKAESISANEALQKNVINAVATNIPDLLQKINGRTVNVNGKDIKLQTKNLDIRSVTPDWRSKLLSVITDPSVAYILLMIGMYGLIFEFSNPGLFIPGVIGGICLLLALYALQLLPISYAGLGLILLGIVFMVTEAFVPSFGALGIGGIIAFIAGSILLMDTDSPAFSIAWPLILSVSAVSAGFFTIIVGMAVRSRQKRVVSGHEAMLGCEGIATTDFTDGKGWVNASGESWQAISSNTLHKGDSIRVVALNGLTATVEKLTNGDRK